MLADRARLAAMTEVEVIRSSPLFDARWYLDRNPEVALTGADPALHYLRQGGFEKRDPGPDFNSDYYLKANPDVRRAGINPLLHYIYQGAIERRSPINAHERWIRDCERLDDGDRAAIRRHIAALARRPVISLVVPVYDTVPSHLTAMIGSVAAQTYPHWELCIADDRSTDPAIAPLLRAAAAADARIRLAFRSTNGHICAATNTAIELATGELIVLLDHDDLLHENALYEIAVELDAHPDADIIFSDSDQVDDGGTRYDPYFKTDWNYDLMLGHNMISHLGAYRRSVVQRLGGMRIGFEGSQDYDLALRVADASEPSRIRHIPALLYHWRRPVETKSFSDRAHAECVAVARTAAREHLARRGIDARVEPAPKSPNFSRVVYALPAQRPLVTVALFAGGDADDLGQRIDTVLRRTSYEPVELLVVCAGAAPAETAAVLGRAGDDARVRVLRLPAAASAARAKNRAVHEARGEVVVLLDAGLRAPDAEWLTALVSHALRPDIGLVGSLIADADGAVVDPGIVLNAHAGTRPGARAYFSIFDLTREVSAVASACVAFRRAVYLAAGGARDELSTRRADIDLSLRVRAAGLRNIVTPDAELVRDTPAAPAGNDHDDGAPGAEDPFYNPNLSLDTLFERAATPPRRRKPWEAAAAT